MNLFFDTNVLLDYLISTRPCHQDAGTLVKSVFCGDINGFISSHSLTDIFKFHEPLTQLKIDDNFCC